MKNILIWKVAWIIGIIQLMHPKLVETSKLHGLMHNVLDYELSSFMPTGLVNCAVGEESNDTISALHRSHSTSCQDKIRAFECLSVKKHLLYEEKFHRNCPLSEHDEEARFMGCVLKKDLTSEIVKGDESPVASNIYSPQSCFSKDQCLSLCFRAGYRFCAWRSNTNALNCLCLPENENNFSVCPKYQNQEYEVYKTGYGFAAEKKLLIKPEDDLDANDVDRETSRILFIIVVSGRATRQVKLLLKSIYDEPHYYFIHVDQHSNYLFQQLLYLERKYPNIRLCRKRRQTIWGSSFLLTMILESLQTSIFEFSHWKWDYVINLSESDLPLKPVTKLARFIHLNKGSNFVRSNMASQESFSRKQGHDRSFLQCDSHMWRLGRRPMPLGVRLDGGSDWFALSREFSQFIVNESHQSEEEKNLLLTLSNWFSLTLLPLETFFHTVIHNTRFCSTYVPHNLRSVKWERKRGCQCQHTSHVDWCGCSPQVIQYEQDFSKLLKLMNSANFFARKFDSVIDYRVVQNLLQPIIKEKISNLFFYNVFSRNDGSKRLDNFDAPVAIRSYNVDEVVFHALAAFSTKFTADGRMNSTGAITVMNVFALYNFSSLTYPTAKSVQSEFSQSPPLPKKSFLIHFKLDGDEYEVMFDEVYPVHIYEEKMHRKFLSRIKFGSHFDSKELVFRSTLNHIILPNQDPIVSIQLEESALGNAPANHSFPTVFVLTLITPNGSIANSSKLFVKSLTKKSLLSAALNVRSQNLLDSGLWKAYLLADVGENRKSKIVAEAKFFVLPRVYINNEDGESSIPTYVLNMFYKYVNICAVDRSSEIFSACEGEEWSSLSSDSWSYF